MTKREIYRLFNADEIITISEILEKNVINLEEFSDIMLWSSRDEYIDDILSNSKIDTWLRPYIDRQMLFSDLQIENENLYVASDGQLVEFR